MACLFVCGFWGLFCFGLPGSCCGGWVGLCGLVFWLFLTVALAWLHALLCGVGWGLLVLFGEFDPGSGRTLAGVLNTCKSNGEALSFLVGVDEWRTGE